MTGEGAVLRAKIELVRPALDVASGLLWHSPDPSAAYARYLAAMYPVTRAAVPLMRFARRRCLRHPADRLSRPLISFLTRHIHEERGHDLWVGADLAALGEDPGRLAGALPVPAITGLIGGQYQLIADVHPIALLGCIALLESAPPGAPLIEHVRGFTRQAGATATLSGHAASDSAHGQAVFALLDGLRLDARLRAAVGYSALHTARQAVALFGELVSGDRPAQIRTGEPTAGYWSEANDDAEFLISSRSEGEAAMLIDIEDAMAGHADVMAHSADVIGGLFL
ncbi:MAG: iron-containing redox enzyme family protein [Actinomycetota bacterium]|nr:iron-containing redox enzyme family protein [Actinomycetota bacterium]